MTKKEMTYAEKVKKFGKIYKCKNCHKDFASHTQEDFCPICLSIHPDLKKTEPEKENYSTPKESKERIMTRHEALLQEARRDKIGVFTWNPGDGITRYRFTAEINSSYCKGDGLYTALGIKEARTWLNGYTAGLWATK